jgi:molybdate transport system substrate-binding protein
MIAVAPRTLRALAAVVTFMAASLAAHAGSPPPVRIYAAASLTGAINEIATTWERLGHPRPLLVFAGSPTLAKQIEAGARADVFISADAGWMDFLAERGRIDPASRTNLVGNALVLVAPQDRPFKAELRPGAALAGAFDGRLCTGETRSVPVGMYAREALESLGVWASLSSRVVGLDDARAALALIERGECGAGIVYATDAAVSTRVVVVARFPPATHRPIVYPAARVTGGAAQGGAFLEFLRSGPPARAVFMRHGFVVPPAPGP